MRTRLVWIDREDVEIGYLRLSSDVADLAALEISWDDGSTWTQLSTPTVTAGVREYKVIVRGPSADSTDGRLLHLGQNAYIVRAVDHPRIKTIRGQIEVR